MLFKLLLIKLACESQLTEMLFKLLIIKLACESQLTEMLFKLLIISGACQRQGITIVILHTYYSSSSSSGQNFGSLLLLHRLSQTHE